MSRRRSRRLLVVLAAVAGLLACGGDDDANGNGGGAAGTQSIILVTHESFAVSDGLLEDFADDSGITVDVLAAGDAGAALNQAILTKDDPQGDVFFGVDNTFLSRALDEDLFLPYESPGLAGVDDELVADPDHRVTPVDYGDVCLNYDRSFFEGGTIAVPQTLDDLTDPAYRDLLVVENPATSSPGLAFLLATVSRFGEDGWRDYWSALRDNGVAVADDWSDAYYNRFSGSADSPGDRPLVVSYASSPPAEVAFSEPPIQQPPTGVIEDGCFRQIEFAGILRGTDDEASARRVVDFLLSAEFQEDMPLNMFVFPVNPDAALPPVFVEHAAVPDEPLQMDPEEIGANRDRWIGEWTDTVLR